MQNSNVNAKNINICIELDMNILFPNNVFFCLRLLVGQLFYHGLQCKEALYHQDNVRNVCISVCGQVFA